MLGPVILNCLAAKDDDTDAGSGNVDHSAKVKFSIFYFSTFWTEKLYFHFLNKEYLNTIVVTLFTIKKTLPRSFPTS